MATTKHGFANRIRVKSKTNVWVEILGLTAKHGALNLALGFPDFEPPRYICEALSAATSGKNYMLNHYTRGAGHPRLVNILAKLYSRQLRHDVNPMSNILTTIGAFDALYTTFQALVNPGDEVILIEPYYEPYKEIVRLAGATAVYVPLTPKNGSYESDDWVYDYKQLEAAFSPRTKAIIVNNPMNPLGKVFSKDELEPIAKLCVAHDVLCISDEVYEYLIYGNRKQHRMATFPGMFERTITIGSAGKTFTVTGWKVGWAIGPANLISALQAFHHNTIRTNPTPLQEAVAVGFETEYERLDAPDCYFRTLAQDMEATRDQLAGYLRDAGLNPILPGGGYFIIADISSLGKAGYLRDAGLNPILPGGGYFIIANISSIDIPQNEDFNAEDAYDYNFVKWAIQYKKLCTVPMSIFFSEEHRHVGEKYVRICFVKKGETILKAKEILGEWNRSSNGHHNGDDNHIANGTNGER